MLISTITKWTRIQNGVTYTNNGGENAYVIFKKSVLKAYILD